MSFDGDLTIEDLASMSDAALDALDFGVVKMDLGGVVLAYNRPESQLSGLDPAKVVGKHFFTEIAPCTNNFMVAVRYEDAEDLDEQINYVFTHGMRPTPVRLRMMKSMDEAVQFLLVRKT